MQFTTTLYQRSHGKAPRGTGCWAFCPAAKASAQDYLAHTVFSPDLSLSKAKAWAKAQPQLQSATLVAVMP